MKLTIDTEEQRKLGISLREYLVVACIDQVNEKNGYGGCRFSCSEFTEQLHIPASTIHRILTDLKKREVIRRDKNGQWHTKEVEMRPTKRLAILKQA